MTIGQIIKKAREQAGLSQNKLAKLAGIRQGNIWAYELDQMIPSIVVVQKIAAALGVKLSKFVKPLDETRTGEKQHENTKACLP